jgi:CPA2 family monovalent cation:H+ antiporter-2
VRELAELWNPDIPIEENTAYVERARAINSEFNTGFLANLTQIVEQDVKEEEELRREETKASFE